MLFENRVVRKLLGSRNEIPAEWKRLHNEEFNDLYSSPNIIRVNQSRRMKLATHVACMGGEGGACRLLVEKSEGTRPLGRPRRRWEDNIKIDLEELGWGGVGWIDLADDRDKCRPLVNAVMNFRVP